MDDQLPADYLGFLIELAKAGHKGARVMLHEESAEGNPDPRMGEYRLPPRDNGKSKIYVTWDAVSWHRSEGLAGWLDAFNETTRNTKRGPIIEVAPLPTSSQFLNVIEGVFSGMMRAIVNNSDYQSDEEMKAAMSRHLWERNLFFRENPKRVGKKIWEIDFFLEVDDLRSGNYRDW